MTSFDDEYTEAGREFLLKRLGVMGFRLESLIRLLSAISRLTAAPLHHRTLEDAAGYLLSVMVKELSDVRACSLLTPDQDGRLRLRAAFGQAELLGEPPGDFNHDLSFAPGEGAAGQAFLNNRPVFWNPDSDEAGLLALGGGRSTPTSLACLPLGPTDPPLGVLNISYDRAAPFSSARRRELVILGEVVGNVIETFRLREEVELKTVSLSQARDQLEDRVRERTAELLTAHENLKQEMAARERAQDFMAKTAAKYQTLFEEAPVGIIQSTLDGRIMGLNPACAQMFGYDTPQAAMEKITDLARDLYTDPEQRRNMIDLLRSEGRLVSHEIQLRRADGGLFTAAISARLARWKDGRGFIEGFLEDITDRKEAERTLIRAREAAESANRAKSDFLDRVSHELRTPLNPIIGMTEVLLETEENPERRQHMNMISFSARRLLGRVNDLIELSGIEAGRTEPRREPFDPEAVLDSVCRKYQKQAENKGLAFICAQAWSGGRLLSGDPEVLSRILSKLVDNAIKFTSRGRVELSGRLIGDNGVRTLTYRVSDTGAGIPADLMTAVFDSFSQGDGSRTRQYGGLGLGLTIAARLARHLGGDIRAESEPGRGSVFCFNLPVEVWSDRIPG